MWICYSFATMVIRMRHTRAHTKNRRSHHGLEAPTLSTCTNCGAKHRPHHMCLDCGFYNGRQVMDLEAKKEKREARMKAKAEAISAQQEAAAPTAAEEISERSPEENKESSK